MLVLGFPGGNSLIAGLGIAFLTIGSCNKVKIHELKGLGF
jgi:hypothetical protein